MTDFANKNNVKKNNNDVIEDYITQITYNYKINLPHAKKIPKLNDDCVKIPTIKTYKDHLNQNYNVAQLKVFAKHYKLKITGNKDQLSIRIFSYLHFSLNAIKIQKLFRMFLVKKYKSLHGIASLERNKCTNSNDFITMEPIEEIKFNQFISYKDVDNFIYGFDISSLHNLYLKTEKDKELNKRKVKNPYNRNIIPETIFKNIRSLIRISKILNIDINLQLEDDTVNVSNEKG